VPNKNTTPVSNLPTAKWASKNGPTSSTLSKSTAATAAKPKVSAIMTAMAVFCIVHDRKLSLLYFSNFYTTTIITYIHRRITAVPAISMIGLR
ncbi:MAG: hypothetical protein QRY16_22000, partial [Enterobacterales bacterium endosymbiont of Blomia tropicalis]|uniref:hypothetical protein n=1 Tax=Mixta mediterraneensis TaxID=2758443 RepID=UPI0025A79778